MGQQYQYFDLSRFPKPWFGEAVGDTMNGIVDSVRYAREQKRKDEEAAQKAKFENDQNANSKAARDEQARKDAVHEKQTNARQQGTDTKSIFALLGQGKTQEAQAAANASQYEDPRSPGNTAGASLKHYLVGPDGKPMVGDDGKPMDYDTAMKSMPGQGPAPMMPGEVDPSQALGRFLGQTPKTDSLQPPNFGQEPPPPEAPPDPTAAAGGLMQLPGMQAMGAGAAGMQNQENQTNYDQQLQQREADKQTTTAEAAKRERYGLSFAGGPETIIDPNQARDAARQGAEEDAKVMENQLASERDPVVRDALKRQIIEKRMQLDKMSRAAIDNAGSQSSSQGFKKQQQDLHDTTAAQKFTMGMRPRPDHQGPDSVQSKRYNLAVSGEVRQKINNVLNQGEFKPVVDSYRTLNQMQELLKSDNSANHKLAAGLWAKWASGPGAVQQSEREEFMNTIGGKFGSVEKVMKNWIDGKLPDDQRQIIVEALERTLIPINEANMGQVMDAVHAAVSNDPNPDIANYGPYADTYVNTYTHPSAMTPSGQHKAGAHPPAPGPGGPPQGGGQMSPQDALMVQKAKAAIANPSTPPDVKASAQKVLQLHGIQ